jgi:hypothetical protein
VVKEKKKNCLVFLHQIHQPLIVAFNSIDAGE